MSHTPTLPPDGSERSKARRGRPVSAAIAKEEALLEAHVVLGDSAATFDFTARQLTSLRRAFAKMDALLADLATSAESRRDRIVGATIPEIRSTYEAA